MIFPPNQPQQIDRLKLMRQKLDQRNGMAPMAPGAQAAQGVVAAAAPVPYQGSTSTGTSVNGTGTGQHAPPTGVSPKGSPNQITRTTNPGATTQKPPSDIGTDEENFIRSLMEGANNVDTSKEDALLQQMFGDQTNTALVNQRASMGRAGFGASGALAAGEGDVRRQTAAQQSAAQFGIDNQMKQEAIQNALGGVNADINLQNAGENKATNDELMKLLGQPPADTTNPAEAGDVIPGVAAKQNGVNWYDTLGPVGVADHGAQAVGDLAKGDTAGAAQQGGDAALSALPLEQLGKYLGWW